MSKPAYVGESMTLSVKSGTTGLTDIKLRITKPDGTDEATDLALTEVGTKKIYKGNYIPLVEGTYFAEIISPTDTVIAGQIMQIDSKPVSKLDLGGAGFDAATDGLSVLSGKLDSITASVGSGNNGFIE